MDATQIHLAQAPPAFCAACYAAQPQRKHVDFGAAYEGPTFAASDPDKPVAGGMTVTVDDLIVCEDCLRQAAALIGMADGEALQAKLTEAEEALARTSDELAKQAAYSAKLEDTLAARPQSHGPAAADAGSVRSAGPPRSNRKRPAPNRSR